MRREFLDVLCAECGDLVRGAYVVAEYRDEDASEPCAPVVALCAECAERAYVAAVAERYALPDRMRRDRADRAEWGFRAALAAARGEATPIRPPRRTRAEERAALLAADRAIIAADAALRGARN